MIYIYRRKESKSADMLTRALRQVRSDCRRVFELESIDRQPGDLFVSWGEVIRPGAYRVLNGVSVKAKLTDALTLAEMGISTISASLNRPAPPIDPAWTAWCIMRNHLEEVPFGRTDAFRQQITRVEDSVGQLRAALAVEAPSSEWVGRTNDH